MGNFSRITLAFENIANAINLAGVSGSMTPEQMPSKISELIKPSGNLNITDTNVKNVSTFATAQVVDSNLVSENIKSGTSILGVEGTFAGGEEIQEILKNHKE